MEYDPATLYFSVQSLVHAASGVAGLINRAGKMRLILGAHDVPEELWEAEIDLEDMEAEEEF